MAAEPSTPVTGSDNAVIILVQAVCMTIHHSLLLWALCLFPTLCPASPPQGSPLSFASGPRQVQLLELYTSEGCSSCPPADRWLRELRNSGRLWKEIVPLAFHVDYWDRLGWRDRFSRAAWTGRQRRYAALGLARSVYTPGFFVNGREWRGWFSKRPLPTGDTSTGTLQVHIDNGQLRASYEGTAAESQPLVLHLALLGMNRSTEVSKGENRGLRLQHDFVVLDMQSLQSNGGPAPSWQWQLPAAHGAEALAAWVTTADSPLVMQAAGGWLVPAGEH